MYIKLPRANEKGSRAQFNAIADFVVLLCVTAPTEKDKIFARTVAAKHREWLWLRSKSFKISRTSMVRLDSLLLAIDNGRLGSNPDSHM